MIITINRETVSGGHMVGNMPVEQSCYDFYGKELISLAAKEKKPDAVSKYNGGKNNA